MMPAQDNEVTLGTLLEKHPEWKDLPIVIERPDGDFDWLGHSGLFYSDNVKGEKVLVFANN